MERFVGKSVYKGIALGLVTVLKKQDDQVRRRKIDNVEAEIESVKTAREQAKEQLQKLYNKALKEVGESNAAIFEVHQMMLEDDDYMKARAADVKDISNRLIHILEGDEEEEQISTEPSIIVADDLSPSETVRMDKEKILAIVTVHGSTNSHTAILARTMNIPALIGVPLDLEEIHMKMTAIVDGFTGEVILEPTQELCEQTRKRMAEEQEKGRILESLKGKENITLDGRRINLYANIGGVQDVAYVLENDAGGIGLFRSEFLYLGREDFPGEEEQFQAYRQVAQMMAGKKVIIRTLDIGADKQVDYFHLGSEMNPAMGYRAIRICLKQPDIFKTQLRAL